MRQIGAALGIAVIGSLLTTQTTNSATRQVRLSALPPALRSTVIARLHAAGVGFTPPSGTSATAVATLRHILEQGLADGARPAMFFAAFVVTMGAGLSFLIPRIATPSDELLTEPGHVEPDPLAAMEALDLL